MLQKMKLYQEQRAELKQIRREGDETRREFAKTMHHMRKGIRKSGLPAGWLARTAHHANEVRELTDAAASIVHSVDAIFTIVKKHRNPYS